MASCYGAAVLGGRLSYECQVGLWLNIDRSMLRHSVETLVAIGGALSQQALPRSLFDAMAEDEAQAEAMHNLHIAQREMECPDPSLQP